MTQVTFGAATTPQLTDLDANFTELYNKSINSAYKSQQPIDPAPTVFGVTLGRQGGASTGFRHYAGLNLSHDGTNWRTGTDGSNNGAAGITCTVGGVMEFFSVTNTGGTSQTIANASLIAKMTLDTSGNLMVGQGTSGLQNSNSVSIQPGTSNGGIVCNHASGTASAQFYAVWGYNATTIGSVTQSGTTAVLYNTTSDQRLKDNVADAADAGALLDAVQVRQFDWRSDGSHQRYGFVAQELVAVVPEAVHQPTNTDEMMAVDYSKLVPLLVKEIQSLRARVHALGG